MADAIDLLLQGKQHANVGGLLRFHHDNLEFLPRFVAEFRLLKRLGRRGSSTESVVHFLRWDQRWNGDGDFEVDDHLMPLAARVCFLLWPDINGMTKSQHCQADEILGTRIRKGKGSGHFIYPGRQTLDRSYLFLSPVGDPSGIGLVRPIRSEDCSSVVIPPAVPVVDRQPTMHELITTAEASVVPGMLQSIVDNSPIPKHPILQAWLRHAEEQPEIFAFMQTKLRLRGLGPFSARSILEYCRHSIRRAAESSRRFPLPSRFGALYCRALIIENPKYNGFCEFRKDGNWGRCNRLLGCTIAPKPVNGESYCRLDWPKEGQ